MYFFNLVSVACHMHERDGFARLLSDTPLRFVVSSGGANSGNLQTATAHMRGARKHRIAKLIDQKQRHLNVLVDEAKQMEQDREEYLRTALVSCRKCIFSGSKYDLKIIFQLIALWFEFAAKFPVVNQGARAPPKRTCCVPVFQLYFSTVVAPSGPHSTATIMRVLEMGFDLAE